MIAAPPKVALVLVTALYSALGVLLLVFGIVLWRGNFGVSLATLFFCLVLGSGIVRVLSTQMDSHGISQLTWRGRLHLDWGDVREVAFRPRVVTLVGRAARFPVHLVFYSDSDAVISFVSSHLPAHLRGPDHLNGT